MRKSSSVKLGRTGLMVNPVSGVSSNGCYKVCQNHKKLMEIRALNWMEARKFAARLLSGTGYSIRYTAPDGSSQTRDIRGDIRKYENVPVRFMSAKRVVAKPRVNKPVNDTGVTPPPLVQDVKRVNPVAEQIPDYVWRLLHSSSADAFRHVCSALMEQGKRMAEVAAKREQLMARRAKLLAEVDTLDAELKTVEEEFSAV